MRFFALFSPLALFPALVASVNVSFDPVYDNANQSLTTVACSTGSNGMITKGFTTFGSLPNFAHIGGAPAITGFNSAACGTCWNLTFVNSDKVSKTISILAIDVATPDFNIALSAMNELTGGQAVNLGRVPITAVQVNNTVCGLWVILSFFCPVPDLSYPGKRKNKLRVGRRTAIER